MSVESRILRIEDVDPQLVRAWDAMPVRRGLQADHYDSHSWLASWCQGVGAQTAGRLRIPAVLDGDDLLGLLPLWARSDRRWESAGVRGGFRLRYRPVLGAEAPDEQVLGLLAEEVSRSQVSDLTISRLPTRDPATLALVAVLEQAGFHVRRYEFSSDHLTVVDGGWEEYRARFAGYGRSVQRNLKRISPWKLCLDEYGPDTAAPPLQGFAVFNDLLGRSWKRSLRGGPLAHRRELMRRTQELGWCRVYVLRVAGVPAAAEIWFRVSDVAIASDTVYDRRLAALAPGTVVAWCASERALTEPPPPRVVDLLPGDSEAKRRLAEDRPPLLVVEATRRRLVSGASFPLRRGARAVGKAAAKALDRVRHRRSGSPLAATSAQVLEVGPGDPDLAAAALEPTTTCLRFLAVAGGHRSPKAMAGSWAPGDSWWRIGPEPTALVRLGVAESGPLPVREVILLHCGRERVEELLGALAAAVGRRLSAALPADGRGRDRARPIPVHRAPLPWPAMPVSATRTP